MSAACSGDAVGAAAGFLPVRPVPAPDAAFSGLNALAGARTHLSYLSELAEELGVLDVVAVYYAPIAKQWSELHTEASRWHTAAEAAKGVSADLRVDLGKVDAGWEGVDAEVFVGYIDKVAAASDSTEDAMNAMATALIDTAEALQQVVADFADILVDTAELTSESVMLPAGGEQRATAQLVEAQNSGKALFEAADDVLQAFGALCDGVDGPDMPSRHRFPEDRFTLQDGAGQVGGGTDSTSPSAAVESSPDHSHQATNGDMSTLPDASAVPDVTPQSVGGPVMMPMGMPMSGGGQGSGSRTRRGKSKPTNRSAELFGESDKFVQPVIGESAPRERARQTPERP